MLTLIQIAAVVLTVLLVVLVARLTRTREDRAERQPALPAGAEGSALTRSSDVRVGGPAREYPLPHSLPHTLPSATMSHGALAASAVPAPVVSGNSPAASPLLAGRSAPWEGVPLGGVPQHDGRAIEPRSAAPLGDTDAGLRDLAARLRDRATALEAERVTQQNEIERLRAALAEAVREVETLRTVRVEVENGPAPEPKLPKVNVYDLRTARRT